MGNKINLALIGAGHWGKNLARLFYELGILRTQCIVPFQKEASFPIKILLAYSLNPEKQRPGRKTYLISNVGNNL